MTTGLLNKDLFLRDPTTFTIPNQGVAKVKAPETPEEWKTLRYELESFVCEGAYERGLDLALSTFLSHLDRPAQPAVWVSGFYGSGKSHFARVLEFIWRDIEFPDGERARNRVRLPESIQAHLRELSTEGRRRGGLWSAAGTLGAAAASTDAVRLGMLGIVFGAAGLPTQFGRARFVLWLKQQGIEGVVREALKAKGRDFDYEAANYLVSPPLHEAILEAAPDLAASRKGVSDALRAQFPPTADVSDDDLVEAIEAVLRLQAEANGKPDSLPLTLVVFDELQQFIGEDPGRTLQVQNVVEAITSRFGSSVLFLATGQSALGATTQLQKLQGRFTVRVTLDNADVERVVREVVLRKKPEHLNELGEVLDRSSGEIARQLRETKIAFTPEQQEDLVPDYPLLPARQEFWERTLMAVDNAGTAGQLRTQLRIVQEATRAVALRPVGHVIPGDAIFEQIRPDLLQSQVLLPEINKTITDLDDGTEDGRLRGRLCALAFLIDQLLPDGPAAIGLRATADNMADLLVEDLDGDGQRLRAKVPALLNGLAERGVLMKTEDEYRLQTREGMQWETVFRERQARVLNDEPRLADERTARLREVIQAEIGRIAVSQGVSKESRSVELSWSVEAPAVTSGKVPIWVRDEWAVSVGAVEAEARQFGTSSPVVSVFLPRREGEAIKKAIGRFVAAEETLNAKGTPTSLEGQQARAAMLSRRDAAVDDLKRLIGDVVGGARVFLGGGTEVQESGLKSSSQKASEAAVERLFPKFKAADHPSWDKVVARAGRNADALEAVGHKGGPDEHAVTSAVLQFVGKGGRKGSEVRDHFQRPPFGWPKDAIDGALIVLTQSGHLLTARNGQPISASELKPQTLGTVDFSGEDCTISKTGWINLRGLLHDWGFVVSTDDEARATVRPALNAMLALAQEAGGQPPIPALPPTDTIRELLAGAGNCQVQEVLDTREELKRDFAAWTKAKQTAAHRLPRWERLQKLLQHGVGLPEVEDVRRQAEAITQGRTLLSEPDPVAPLLSLVAEALRAAVLDAHDSLKEIRQQELAALEHAPEWRDLEDAEWRKILQHVGLGPVAEPLVGTDEALIATLDREPLAKLEEQRLAIPERIKQARLEAARRTIADPVRVRPKSATLKDRKDLDTWLENLRCEILGHLDSGKPVVI